MLNTVVNCVQQLLEKQNVFTNFIRNFYLNLFSIIRIRSIKITLYGPKSFSQRGQGKGSNGKGEGGRGKGVGERGEGVGGRRGINSFLK